MGKKKKCKTCGQMFEPKGSDNQYCSPICRATGCFVGGGGDRCKPMGAEQRKTAETKSGGKVVKPSSHDVPRKKRVNNGEGKYPRVHYMFSLPLEQRWAVASKFTPEEREYSLKLQRAMLREEARLDELLESTWGDEEKVNRNYEGLLGGRLGDSDDGSI